MPDETTAGGFWRTLPGVLTAMAALLTAVGGLVVALHQTGILGGRPAAGASYTPLASGGGTSGTSSTSGGTSGSTGGGGPVAGDGAPGNTPTGASTTGAATARSLALAGTEVRVDVATFRIVSADLVSVAPGQGELRLAVRVTNGAESNYLPVSVDSFRLLVDSVPQPPTSAFDTWTAIPPRSAQAGTVTFALPDGARSVALVMTAGNASRTVPVDLGVPHAAP